MSELVVQTNDRKALPAPQTCVPASGNRAAILQRPSEAVLHELGPGALAGGWGGGLLSLAFPAPQPFPGVQGKCQRGEGQRDRKV